MKNVHEGIISLFIECDDPDDSDFRNNEFLEPETLKKHNLKPGDRVQYRKTDGDIVILGKIYTKRIVEKVDNKS